MHLDTDSQLFGYSESICHCNSKSVKMMVWYDMNVTFQQLENTFISKFTIKLGVNVFI